MGVLVQILVRFHMDRAKMDATDWCGLSEKADHDEVEILIRTSCFVPHFFYSRIYLIARIKEALQR
jgi:hypothetical protein